eukprot:1516528-Alexandrium_andersonii.AAC.1
MEAIVWVGPTNEHDIKAAFLEMFGMGLECDGDSMIQSTAEEHDSFARDLAKVLSDAFSSQMSNTFTGHSGALSIQSKLHPFIDFLLPRSQTAQIQTSPCTLEFTHKHFPSAWVSSPMLIGCCQPHLQGARKVAETAGEIRGPRQRAITNL